MNKAKIEWVKELALLTTKKQLSDEEAKELLQKMEEENKLLRKAGKLK